MIDGASPEPAFGAPGGILVSARVPFAPCGASRAALGAVNAGAVLRILCVLFLASLWR